MKIETYFFRVVGKGFGLDIEAQISSCLSLSDTACALATRFEQYPADGASIVLYAYPNEDDMRLRINVIAAWSLITLKNNEDGKSN